MSSKIVGWLVGDWDGKKSDLKKNLNKKKISELNLKRRNPVFLPLKILDIRLCEVGAKRRLNGTLKVNTQKDRQTDGQTDGHFDLQKASAQRADALKILHMEDAGRSILHYQ